MAADGQVVFEISADGKKAIAQINDLVDAIEKAGKTVDDTVAASADDMTKSMSRAFDINRIKDWSIQAAKAVIQFAESAISAASDLEEVQNVVDTTFGANAAQIDTWAKTAQTQFGLTETQAKKFTSTLGAMMKSAGMAGPEIVTMSEDLAGLAADMASFYNLDFETAFQKIRSGISGETEPLKQLGINMSVANLEAYALTQGITKAFDKMSQGEQTMLRYQYLMQATADAQGDFARTSDGYANSLRLLQTNIESIKTSVGTLLIPAIADVVSYMNEGLAALTQPKPTTVLDEVAAIDLDKEKKIREIEDIANKANDLIEILGDLGATSAGDAVKAIAEGANVLNASSPGTWTKLLGALEGVDGLNNIFSGGTAAGGNIKALANALAGASVDTSKAEAWQTLLGALSDNADALTALTGTSVEETKAWLDGLAESANALDPSTAEGWDTLLSDLVKGLPGLEGTETGAEFFAAIKGELLALGSDSETAKAGLAALGMSSEEIDKAQSEWLETCKRLVQTIPGLNKLINTQTGEVTGGIPALEEYVKQWQDLKTAQAELAALQQRKSALEASRENLASYRLDMLTLQKMAETARKEFEALNSENIDVVSLYYKPGLSENDKKLIASFEKVQQAEKDAAAAEAEYNRQLQATQEMEAATAAVIADEEARLTAAIDAGTAAIGEQTEAYAELSEEAKTAASALEAALTAAADYAENVHNDTVKSINSVVGGLEKVETPAQKARKQLYDLNSQINELNAAGQDTSGLEKTFDSISEGIPSVQSMTKALESQVEFMRNYQDNLAVAAAKGVNADLLAELSDGSVESADYLAQLIKGSDAEIEALNTAYAEKQAQAEEFANTLTESKLTADETYQGLVATADQAMKDLDQKSEAHLAAANTVSGLIEGLEAMRPSLESEVDAIIAQLDRLSSFGAVSYSNGSISFGTAIEGSHAAGLEWVPFDNYLAALHEGESVLTAEEARAWRAYRDGVAGSRNALDYGALSGAIWDNAPAMGGNVYLDGRTVGRVISGQQAASYRQLERSGWQG